MAEICEAGVRRDAVGTEVRRCRISPAVGEDVGRKRRRLERERGAANESGSRKSTAIESGPSRGSRAYGCPRYGVTSVCGRRREMEDAVSVRPDFVRLSQPHHFFGVFDGHGCSHVAEWCKDRMHEIVAEEISASSPGPDREWTAVMERSFARMDSSASARCSDGPTPAGSCRCELQAPRCDHVGSTAVVAVVSPARIVVANCGDSRAVLCRGSVAVPLSSDHKPDRPDELQRIEAAGGRVIYWEGARVLGVLATSRAIGDSCLKPYVTAEPEVTVTEREEGDECLILGSDGLWDVVSNELACEIARTCLRTSSETAAAAEEEGGNKACTDAAVLLTKLALARRSADNVTVLVVDLRRRF